MIGATALSPGRRFAPFLPVLRNREILDLGLRETELVRSRALADWIGAAECHLKLETTHPTGTVKDRIAELVLSYFQMEGVKRYAHCSAGNAGTSLVWGAEKAGGGLSLELFVPETQLPYHNFRSIPGLTVTLVEGSDYDEAKQYCAWYAKTVLGQPEYMNCRSPLRQQVNKLPYLEAYEQLGRIRTSVDFVCQAISDGGGIVGAALAAEDAVAEGWLPHKPAFVVAQPVAANPVVRCFREGNSTYQSSCSLPRLAPSRAFAIRRKNASAYYGVIHEVIRNGGHALDADEEEIAAAKKALFDLEGIEAGCTACTALAALRRENGRIGAFRGKALLVMITGIDRPTGLRPRIDRRVPESEWRGALASL